MKDKPDLIVRGPDLQRILSATYDELLKISGTYEKLTTNL